ncbi:ATP-dependent helicase, partial [Streptomyces anulatus]|nr:ATP-dependent helicase [Streptomyces anulatus]
MTARTREGERWDTEDTSRTADAGRLLRCAAVFLPGPVPRDGRIAFWDPLADAGPWHDGGAQERSGTPFGSAETPGRPDSVPYTTAPLTVVRPDPAAGPGSVRAVVTPAALLSVADALPLLVRARTQGS